MVTHTAQRRSGGLVVIVPVITLILLPLLGFGAYWLRRHRGPPLTRSTTTNSKEVERTSARRLSYRYADDRIFINGGGVWTGVVLGTVTDEFATDDEAADIALRPAAIYRDLLGLFGGQRVHCHELVRYRPITTKGWLAQLLDHAWNPTDLYRVLAGKAADHIATSTPQRVWTLLVRLGDFPPTTATDPLSAAAASITGVAEERFTRADLAPWWARAEHLHEVVGRHGAEPLTRRDLLWLIRKPGFGHLPISDPPTTRARPWRGGFFELAASIRGTNLGGGYLRLQQRDPDTGHDNTTYTATLVIADQPMRQVFTARGAWSRRLARLATPAEISWRYTLVAAAEWKTLTARVVANIEDERKDRDKAGADPDPKFQARLDQADQLRDDTTEDPQPGMIGRLRLTVSAPSEALLAKAIHGVKAAMGDIHVEVPHHAQLLLLAEQLPGEGSPVPLGSLSAGPAGGLRLWQRHSDTYLPALGMLGSHNQVGDRVQVERGRALGWIGVPIGYVQANGSVVHYDPHAQVNRNHGAGIAVLGSSGSGKTSFAFLMFFWLSESGVRCSVLDPKIDFANFVYYISFGPQVLDPGFMADADRGTLGTAESRFQPVNRQFWDDTVIIDLARGTRGSQDPWRITSTFDEGYNLALNLTDAVFTDPDHRRIVRTALRGIAAAHKAAPTGAAPPVGYADVLDHIRTERAELENDYTVARERATDTSSLRVTRDIYDEVIGRFENADIPFLRLLMGKGTDGILQDHGQGKRRLVYTLAGFKTPDHPDDPELWTDEDRNAAAAMLAVLYRMRKDNLSGRMQPNPVTAEMGIPPTAAFVDEANMITAIPAGRAYLVVNLRQGRSLDSVLFFMAQQSRDPQRIEAESIKAGATEVNQFGTVAMFRQKSKSEALAALELLRSSGDEVPQAELDNLAKKLQSAEVGGLLRPGDCVLRDPDSRVAAVTIDQLFYVLQRAAQTNAQLKPVDWAHPVPTRPQDWEINPEALLRVRTQANAPVDHLNDHPTHDGDDDWTDDWADDTWGAGSPTIEDRRWTETPGAVA